MSDFWKTVRARRVREALIAKAKTGIYGDPGVCGCCGEEASQIETRSGTCLLCFIDGTGRGVPRSCHACARGGRAWKLLPEGQEPPFGAALRTRDGVVEYADPVLPREDA